MKKFRLLLLLTVSLCTIFLLSSCKIKEDLSESEPTEKSEDTMMENTKENTYESISMEEAFLRLKEETGYILLDVRTEEEYKEGHIPGAINYKNEDIVAEMIPVLPDLHQRIYVYCRSGRRSKEAALKLTEIGYTNIVEIGGIIDWKGEIVTD